MVIERINDINSEVPISPSHILTMKSKDVMPPCGVFGKPDLYCQRRWMRIQHTSNEFWGWWRKEFLVTLEERQKWREPQRNFSVGDIVFYKDKNGYIQSLQLYIGNSDSNALVSHWCDQYWRLFCWSNQTKRSDPQWGSHSVYIWWR